MGCPLWCPVMRGCLRALGNLLVLTGFLVGASLFLRTGGATAPAPEPSNQSLVAELLATPTPRPPPPVPTLVAATPTPEPRLPITRVVIARIDLDTEVVTAPLVERNGERTWLVPAFKAGQAEYTAGAGQRGNAVVMGHVSSLHSGDVFKNLDQVQLGDEVEVFSRERRFAYRVFEARAVPRTDLAMVAPTSEPILSLFTCTGAWDPAAWDYTERLFVRARLFRN